MFDILVTEVKFQRGKDIINFVTVGTDLETKFIDFELLIMDNKVLKTYKYYKSATEFLKNKNFNQITEEKTNFYNCADDIDTLGKLMDYVLSTMKERGYKIK